MNNYNRFSKIKRWTENLSGVWAGSGWKLTDFHDFLAATTVVRFPRFAARSRENEQRLTKRIEHYYFIQRFFHRIKYISSFRISLLFITMAFVLSCEESVDDLALPAYQPKIVIDGWIEQGQFAEVTLTKSASYFADIDSAALREALVSTAKVSVSDGETTEVLTLFRNSEKFPPFFYRGTKLKGEVGKTYTLLVETQGESYEARTSIPPPPTFDSLWFEFDHEEDSLGALWATFSDEPDVENYYRVFTRQENKDQAFVPMYLSAIGDKFFDGKSFSFNILKGTEGLSDISNDFYFSRGDTLRIRFCSIDQAHFDFWRTLEREIFSVGNPFSASGNEILSNTSEGALGIWGGYGASYYRIIVK